MERRLFCSLTSATVLTGVVIDLWGNTEALTKIPIRDRHGIRSILLEIQKIVHHCDVSRRVDKLFASMEKRITELCESELRAGNLAHYRVVQIVDEETFTPLIGVQLFPYEHGDLRHLGVCLKIFCQD